MRMQCAHVADLNENIVRVIGLDSWRFLCPFGAVSGRQTIFHGLRLRPAVAGLRFTRGYNRGPRWGRGIKTRRWDPPPATPRIATSAPPGQEIETRPRADMGFDCCCGGWNQATAFSLPALE